MKYKWIVADCDDTLLKGNLELSARTIEAVRRYQQAGGRFTIATGRMPKAILPYCQRLGLQGEVVCFQGAVIADIATGEVLETTMIPLETAIEVGRYLEEHGLYYHIYRGPDIVYHKRSIYSLIYSYFCRCGRRRVDVPLTQYMREQGESTIKLLMMESPRKVPRDLQLLRETFADTMLVNTSKSFLVEMVDKRINKGVALERLGRKYGIAPEETIAIGDSSNDISMVQYAGLGVAMGNADEQLKGIADAVAPDNEHDGVAYIIEKYGLGDPI